MPIRTLPVNQITEGTLTQMMSDEVREDSTLDYKREIELEGRDKLSRIGKLKFLEHMTSMANGSGGVVLYGAEEGNGGDRGRIVALPGMDIDPDSLIRWLGQLLERQVDEPMPTPELHAIPLANGRHCLLARVVASPLAPHMILLTADDTDRSRFYMRANAASVPMTARQIKEVTMRSETAIERAEARLSERYAVIERTLAERAAEQRPGRQADESLDAITVHLLPLHGSRGGPDLTSDVVVRRMHLARPFGNYVELAGWSQRIGLEGIASEARGNHGVDHWTLLLRGGGLEYVAIDESWPDATGKRRINGQDLEKRIIGALEQARELASEGLLATPLVLAVRLFNVKNIILDKASGCGPFRDAVIAVPPVLISRWEELPAAITDMYHVLWQASGIVRSPYLTAQQSVDGGRL